MGMTASHNPGGPDADFGIKFNCSNGGPAPDSFTNKIFDNTKNINKYSICPDLQCDFDTVGVYEYLVEGNTFTVEVIDPTVDYVQLMKEIFDFDQIKKMIKEKNFKLLLTLCMAQLDLMWRGYSWKSSDVILAAVSRQMFCLTLEEV